jgi:hypothetical protein
MYLVEVQNAGEFPEPGYHDVDGPAVMSDITPGIRVHLRIKETFCLDVVDDSRARRLRKTGP